MSETTWREVAVPDGRAATMQARRARRDLRWWVLKLRAQMLHLRRRAPRRLRLCESLPLGERRFVAVVEFERSRFLVGGTSASLVLLARLENVEDETGCSVSEPTAGCEENRS
jgi:flagellar biogenesis protein FliO